MKHLQGVYAMKTTTRHFRNIMRHLSRSLYASHLLIVLVAVSLLFGCDSASSPTGPGELFSPPDTTLAVSAYNATFHAIIAVDTDAGGEVADALRSDLNNVNALVDTIANQTGLILRKHVLSGSHATVAHIQHTIDTMDVGPDDVLLFYFSGHGGRLSNTSSQWPEMFLRDSRVNLTDIFSRLRHKGGRLVLALGDACNINLDSSTRRVNQRSVDYRGKRVSEGFRKLFLETRAAIIASSSVPGEVAYAPSDGSVFTTQFLQALSQKVSGNNPDWVSVMNAATQRIRIAGVQQQPQYTIY
jgi:hypothetical protein